MTVRPDTWMPIYWGDYVRDTGHLNAAGHGAYLMLIKHYWCTGAPLQNDDDELWRVACCDSKREWLNLRSKIVRLFQIDGDFLRHKRIDRELAKGQEVVSAKSAAGKRGAESRWHNRGVKITEPHLRQWQNNATAMAEPSVCHRQNDGPSPSPSSSFQSEEFSEASASAAVNPAAQRNPSDEKSGNPQKSAPLQATPPDIRTEFWTDGLAVFRRITGKTDGQSRAFLGKVLRDLHDDCAAGLAILRQAETDRPGEPIAWLQAAVLARDKPEETRMQRRNRAVLDALGIDHGAAP